MVKIPDPITFNPHKHHYRFLLQEIGRWQTWQPEAIEKELLLLGENLLDFYFGKLSVTEICSECLYIFNKEKINNSEKLNSWLFPFEFRKITLSDSSEWVVKAGLDSQRFLHIHPAKQSPFTVRARAATLKTVVALQILSVPVENNSNENLQNVNKVRKEILHLSPIKTLHPQKGIYRFWVNFVNGFQ